MIKPQNPFAFHYSKNLTYKQIDEMSKSEIWEAFPNLNNISKSYALGVLEFRKIKTGQYTVKDFMTDKKKYEEVINILQMRQNQIGRYLTSSTFIDDSWGRFDAINLGWQRKNTKKSTTKTLNKIRMFMENDDREGFLKMYMSRARSESMKMLTTSNIDNLTQKDYEINNFDQTNDSYSLSSLDILLAEEEEDEVDFLFTEECMMENSINSQS